MKHWATSRYTPRYDYDVNVHRFVWFQPQRGSTRMPGFTEFRRSNAIETSAQQKPSGYETVKLPSCIGAWSIPRILSSIQCRWTIVSFIVICVRWSRSNNIAWQLCLCCRCYPINTVLADPHQLDRKLREYRSKKVHVIQSDSESDSDDDASEICSSSGDSSTDSDVNYCAVYVLNEILIVIRSHRFSELDQQLKWFILGRGWNDNQRWGENRRQTETNIIIGIGRNQSRRRRNQNEQSGYGQQRRKGQM